MIAERVINELKAMKNALRGDMDETVTLDDLNMTIKVKLEQNEYLGEWELMGEFTDKPKTRAWCDRVTGNILADGEPVHTPPDGWEYDDNFGTWTVKDNPDFTQWVAQIGNGVRRLAIVDNDQTGYWNWELTDESWPIRKVELSYEHVHDRDAPGELWYTPTGDEETDAAALVALDEYLVKLEQWVQRHTNEGELIVATGGPRKCYDPYRQAKYFQPANDLSEGYPADYIMSDWRRVERIEDGHISVCSVHITIEVAGDEVWERWYGSMDVDSWSLNDEEEAELVSLITEPLNEFEGEFPGLADKLVADMYSKAAAMLAAAANWERVSK